MTIPGIDNRQVAPLAAERLSAAGIKKLARFSIKEHLAHATDAETAPNSGRSIIDAAPLDRQVNANIDGSVNPAPLTVLYLLGNIKPQPFYLVDPNSDPADPNGPAMIQDPTATAPAQVVRWTAPNGLTTTGIMNPFGLTKNDASIGFYGAQPPAVVR